MYQNIIKPFFDFLAALFLLILLSPLLIILLIALAIANNGSPFFKQKRPGKNEKIFTIVKFKTMTDTKDDQGQLLPDNERLTPMGKFVRSTSLDELPQILNVLKGEMSFVGPRPLLPEYLSLYSAEQNKRHNVKPGITGWAQVNGRNAISWDKKLELDTWYASHQSFGLDIRILMMTIKKVIMKEGINQQGEATTTHFKGN